jgi:hydroxymethylbilane synthase
VTDRLRIGSRGSKLALVQSEWVRDRLHELHPGLTVEIEVIHTKGDKILDAPLAKIGDKGLFTKELEAAIVDRRVDLAVHSAKDMPTETPEGLAIVAFTAREDVRDVFVGPGAGTAPGAAGAPLDPSGARAPQSLSDLSPGAIVGTSSLRRRSQLLAARPDLTLVDIRGNVETRLRKVEDEGMAGTVLAAAGLARLGRAGAAAFAFSFADMLPAVGQGALAIEARADDAVVRALVAPLLDEPTAAAVRAERALMHALEGGCQVPIAGLGESTGAGAIWLRAFVGSLDGTDVVRLERRGTATAPEELGRALAADLLAAGADRILRGVRGEDADG